MFTILLLVGFAEMAAPAPPTRPMPLVAVMPLEARKIDTSDALTLRDALSNDLVRTGEVRVMERAQIETILREQGFQQSGLCDQGECAVQMGKMLGIDRIVVGSVGKIGETYTVSLRMVDVTTGEVRSTASRNQRGQIDAVLTDLLPQVAMDLVRKRQGNSATPQVAESGRSRWPWIVGGLVATGGAVAGAVFLLADQTETASPQPVAPPASNAWDATVSW